MSITLNLANGKHLVVEPESLNVAFGPGLHGAYSGDGRYAMVVIDLQECIPWLSKNAQAKGKDTKLVASTRGAVTMPTGDKLMVNVIQGKQAAAVQTAKPFGA